MCVSFLLAYQNMNDLPKPHLLCSFLDLVTKTSLVPSPHAVILSLSRLVMFIASRTPDTPQGGVKSGDLGQEQETRKL